MIVIKTDFNQAVRAIDLLDKQHRYAAAVALTRTAEVAQREVVATMARNFDRPTAYTLKATRLIPATRDRLIAQVWLKDRQSKVVSKASHFLYPQTFGGRRERKAYETALLRAGVLRSNELTVPAQGLPLDAFGNVPVGVIKRILSQLKAAEISAGSTQNKSGSARSKRTVAKAGTYFASPGQSRGNALPRGIYQRVKTGAGWATRLVLAIVVGKPNYRSRIPFFEIGRRASAEFFKLNYELELERALATAKHNSHVDAWRAARAL